MAKSNIKSAVFEYFSLTEDGCYYVCQCHVPNSDEDDRICNAKISSKVSNSSSSRAGNLKRHIKSFHPKIMNEINEKDTQTASCVTSCALKSTPVRTPQAKLTNFFVADKVTISMTPAKFKENIIGMVVIDSLPLTHFSGKSFQGIAGEMAQKFNISLHRDNIR